MKQCNILQTIIAIIALITAQQGISGCEMSKMHERSPSSGYDAPHAEHVQSAMDALNRIRQSYSSSSSPEWSLISVAYNDFANSYDIIGRFGKNGSIVFCDIWWDDGAIQKRDETSFAIEDEDMFSFYATTARELIALGAATPLVRENDEVLLMAQYGSNQRVFSVSNTLSFLWPQNSDDSTDDIDTEWIFMDVFKYRADHEGVIPGLVETILRISDEAVVSAYKKDNETVPFGGKATSKGETRDPSNKNDL